MKRTQSRFAVSLSLGLQVLAAGSWATDWTVVQGPSSLTFNPSTLTIAQGDTVTWTNAATITHTSTSGTVNGAAETPDQLWSLSNSSHQTHTVNFAGFAPRTYPYYCIPHGTLGMVGSITVTGSVVQPKITRSTLVAAGQVNLQVSGQTGELNIIENSADLLSWSPVSTNLALATLATVTNLPVNPNPVAFYRVRLGP